MSIILWIHLVVAGSLMPVPPATIHHGPCPAALPATVSCAYQGTSEIYLVQREEEEAEASSSGPLLAMSERSRDA